MSTVCKSRLITFPLPSKKLIIIFILCCLYNQVFLVRSLFGSLYEWVYLEYNWKDYRPEKCSKPKPFLLLALRASAVKTSKRLWSGTTTYEAKHRSVACFASIWEWTIRIDCSHLRSGNVLVHKKQKIGHSRACPISERELLSLLSLYPCVSMSSTDLVILTFLGSR